MDFFAITGGRQVETFRMDVERPLQEQLSQLFNLQAQSFLNADLVVVPFERDNFHPDETEILRIAPFELPEHIVEAVDNAVGWPALPNTDEVLSRVICVFAHDADADRLIFQVISSHQRFSRNGFNLILGPRTFTRLDASGLSLGNSSHAVYERGELKFKSIWWLKQIFDIAAYYEAATDADLDTFAALENVSVQDLDTLKRQSGPWARTRIAYILDSGILDRFTARELAEKAAEFQVRLEVANDNGVEKLVVPSDRRALRATLKFLEEEYYEGPITGAAYETNSKRLIAR